MPTLQKHLCLKRLAPLDVTFALLAVTLRVKYRQEFCINLKADSGYKKSIERLAIIFWGG